MAPSAALVALGASTGVLLAGAVAITLYLHRQRILDALEYARMQAEVRQHHSAGGRTWAHEFDVSRESVELSQVFEDHAQRKDFDMDTSSGDAVLINDISETAQEGTRPRHGFTDSELLAPEQTEDVQDGIFTDTDEDVNSDSSSTPDDLDSSFRPLF